LRGSGIAAVAAALALASFAPRAEAHGGGGGGGVHYVIVTVPGRMQETPAFTGHEAAVPLEVTDAAPTLMAGDGRRGDVIAVHTVRATDAIVLLEPAKGRHATIPAGVVLARVSFVSPNGSAVVWCDVRPSTQFMFRNERDCFQDSKGDGHLDRLWRGDSLVGFLGMARSGVEDFDDSMDAPVAYRPARPEERPTASLGYRYCDGDDLSGPARFALVLGTDPDPARWTLTGDCRAGVWDDPADKSKVDVDGLMLTVEPGHDYTIHFQVLNRIPPEALGPLEPKAPLQSLADTPDPAKAAAARQAILAQQALISTGVAPTIALGTVEVGQSFLSGPVKHAITGTLRNKVNPSAGIFWPQGTLMPVGQPMFGIPDAGAPGDGITWCAPMLKAGVFQTYCLVPETDAYMAMMDQRPGYYWLGALKPAMSPSRASFDTAPADPASSDPTVTMGPVNLPPMTVSLQLTSIKPRAANDPTLVYDIDVLLDWGEGAQKTNSWAYELPPQGRTVAVLGTFIVLKPGASPTQMIVEAAPPPPPIRVNP